MTRILITLTTFAALAMASPPNDCETRLQTKLANVIAIGHGKGEITIAEIETLAASPTPYNPLRAKLPTIHNTALRHTLDANIRALPAAQWPAVQKELQSVLVTARRREGIAHQAERATEKLFIPSFAGSFNKDAFSERDVPAFAYTNEQGHLIGVYLAGPRKAGMGSDASYLHMTDLTAKTATERTYVGTQHKAGFSAWVTPQNHLRLAWINKDDQLKIIAYPDAENSRTISLHDDKNAAVAASLPSTVFQTKSGHQLIAVANRSRVQVLDLENPEEPLFSWSTDYEFPDPQLFETQDGKLLISLRDHQNICAFQIGGGILLNRSLPSVVSSFSWWQGAGGKVYLSTVAGGAYRVFTPLDGQDPYFTAELLPSGRDPNYWFRGKDGHDYNYVMSAMRSNGTVNVQVATFDLTDKRKVYTRESAKFGAGSPVVDASYKYNPRVILTGDLSHRGLISVINPLDEGYPTEEFQLPLTIPAVGFQNITRLANPLGEDALLISDRNSGNILNLYNKTR